jgi:hypothetical protein
MMVRTIIMALVSCLYVGDSADTNDDSGFRSVC